MLELNQSHVYTDVELAGNDELSVINQIAGMVSAEFSLPVQEIRSGLFAREAEGSTAISQHVIMPHANGTGLEHPEVLTISFAEPVAWDATSAEQIQVAIVLVMPRNDEQEDYQPAVERLAKALADPAEEQVLLDNRHDPEALSKVVNGLLPAAIA